MRSLIKSVDVSSFVFFDPKEFINKCFDPNYGEELLPEIRKIRQTLMKLVINVDKVIFQLCNESTLNLSKEIVMLSNLFDGLGIEVKKQKKEFLRIATENSRVAY